MGRATHWVSTCPALIPARQGTDKPARSSSGCGERLGVETHGLGELKWDQKSKLTCLHLRARSLTSARCHVLPGTPCLGLRGRECLCTLYWGMERHHLSV